MKLENAKRAQSNVRLAAKDTKMTKLGLSTLFTLCLNGIKTDFEVKAIMIKELADDINLGTEFLQKAAAYWINTPLTFHLKGTTLHMGKEAINLVSKVAMEEETCGSNKEGFPPKPQDWIEHMRSRVKANRKCKKFW